MSLMQMSFAGISASCGEALEENVSYPYLFYHDAEEVSDEEAEEHESKDDLKKNKSKTAQHAKIGKAEVMVDVENTDFKSQCQAQWEKRRNKGEKKKRSDSKKDDETEDSHSPKVKASIKWSSED